MSHKIECSFCHRPFHADRRDAEYCSTSCRQRAYVRRKKIEAGEPVTVNLRRSGSSTPVSVNKPKSGRRNAGVSGARLVLDDRHRSMLPSQVFDIGERDGSQWRVCNLDAGSWIVQRRRMMPGKPWVTRAEADGPYQIEEMLSLLAMVTPGVRAPLVYDADGLLGWVKGRQGGSAEWAAA